MSKGRSHWPISALSVFSSLFNLFLPLALVRILPPAEIGVFKLFFLYVVVLPAFSLTWGVMSGLGYWAGQGARRESAFRLSSMMVIGSALLFSAVAWWFRPLLMEQFGWNIRETHLFILAMFCQMAHTFFEEACIATGRIWTGALFLSSFEILRTMSMLVAAIVFGSFDAVLLAHVGIMLAKVVVGNVYGFRLGFVGWSRDGEILRQIWRFAFPVSAAWMFGTFMKNPDQLVLSHLVTPTEFAFYSIGCLLLPPLLILEQSVVRVLIPQLASAFSTGNERAGALLYRNSIQSISLFVIPAVGGLIVFSRPIIELLFTAQYSSAHGYTRLYAVWYLLLLVPFDAVARARGRATWMLGNCVFFAFFSVGIAYLLTLWCGAKGALWGLIISGSLMRLNAIRFMGREVSWSFRELFPIRNVQRKVLLVLVLSVVSISLNPLFTSERAWFLVCAPIFAVVYLGAELVLSNIFDRPMSTSNNILILAQSLSIGGLERMILSLCVHLKREGRWNVSVMAYDQDPDDGTGTKTLISEFERASIPVDAFKKRRGFSPGVVVRLLRRIFSQEIAIIHCHDLGGLMYGAFAKILSGGKIRLIQTQHSFIHLDKNARYRLYEKLFTRFADEITVVSEDTRDTYRQLGFPPERIHLIENGVQFLDAPVANRREKIASRVDALASLGTREMSRLSPFQNDFWIVYIARLYPRKGQDHAIALWTHLPEVLRKKSVILFVGPEGYPGEQDRIASLIARAPDSDRLLLLGGSASPHLWLRGADIYLTASEYEGMPLSPLEAAGAGVPVVASDIPGHEFLKGFGALYNLSNPDEGSRLIAEELSRIEGNRSTSLYSERWTSAGPLREQYSLKTMTNKFSAIYDNARITGTTIRNPG